MSEAGGSAGKCSQAFTDNLLDVESAVVITYTPVINGVDLSSPTLTLAHGVRAGEAET